MSHKPSLTNADIAAAITGLLVDLRTILDLMHEGQAVAAAALEIHTTRSAQKLALILLKNPHTHCATLTRTESAQLNLTHPL